MTKPPCPFCAPDADRIFHAGDRILGLWDGFPVSPGHALLITKRHVASWFDVTDVERSELIAGLDVARQAIEKNQSTRPDGYNIGINVEVAAGQTVKHVHVHVIPRYRGDMEDPRGGVRHVIPDKGNYFTPPSRSFRPTTEAENTSIFGGATESIEAVPHTRGLISGGDDPLLPHLRAHIDASSALDIAVAFILESGLNELEEHFVDLLRRGGRLRLLTGDYLGVTDPRALRRLLDLQAEYPELAEVRVVNVPLNSSFHPKAYILEAPSGTGIALVGSSNMTKTGLGAAGAGSATGIEWSYRTISSRDERGYADVALAFERLFVAPETQPLSDEWIDLYESRRDTLRNQPAREVAPVDEAIAPPPEPHHIQLEALSALANTRAEGYGAGLVVMATGLGKTWLAAFDSMSLEFKRVLFVAHREEILRQSLTTFRRIRPDAHLGLYTGQEKVPEAEIVFASI